MTVEMTRDEAQLLIAVLVASEQALTGEIALALRDLRQWRSVLLQKYLADVSGRGLQKDEA